MNNQWRNHFHIEMEHGLINDPNGLCYVNGEYKLFYQWNPTGCEHKNKHWGLVKTRDFVHYSKPEIILKPDQTIDKDGCYSGTGAMINGQLHLFYTGNVKDGEIRIPHQCVAVLDEADKLLFKEALIIGSPKGYTGHFRDPFYFKMNDMHCLLLGIQNDELKGRMVVYTSKDLKHWDFHGEIKTALNDFGYMWECPNLVFFDDTDALIFSPQGLKAEALRYQNRYQSGYVLGKYDYEKNEFKHDDFHELDHGFDFYAPQVFNHDGRTMMIAWMGMPDEESEYPTAEDGYLYTLTLPRDLTLKNGRLLQKLSKEYYELRDKQIFKASMKHAESFSYPLNSCAELMLELDYISRIECAFVYGNEQLKLILDPIKETCTLVKAGFHYGKDMKRCMSYKGNHVKLQMVLDTSVLEIFFNEGETVMSSLFYPLHELNEFKISSDAAFDVLSCDIWQLKGITYE